MPGGQTYSSPGRKAGDLTMKETFKARRVDTRTPLTMCRPSTSNAFFGLESLTLRSGLLPIGPPGLFSNPDMRSRFHLLLTVVALSLADRACAQSPATELAAALADTEQLAAHEQKTTRYLSLFAVRPDRRDEVAAVASYTLNALSRSRGIVPPTRVTATLLRFNIEHYTTGKHATREWLAAWEKIVELDPYWHIRTDVVSVGNALRGVPEAPIGVSASTRPIPARREHRGHSLQTQTVTVDGGWVNLPNAARLKQLTASNGALLRADHFIATASVPPRYYEFAGVEAKEADFLKSLGVDVKAIEQLRANAGANLILSGVTQKPRRIVWQQGPLGGVYSTLDVERVAAERDPIRRPLSVDGLAFEYDASEWFAMRANGLWLTALYNRAGQRQDSVPDRVAKDTSDPAADGIIVPMLSCIRCHREGGLRPFRDDQHSLRADGIEFRTLRAKDAERAAEFYDEPRLRRQIEFDRETYSRAVARATAGMRPSDLADALARTAREFLYTPVTPEQAARELGPEPDQHGTTDILVRRFRAALTNSRDPILLMLRQGRPVLRGQWESSFAEAAVLVGAASRAAP